MKYFLVLFLASLSFADSILHHGCSDYGRRDTFAVVLSAPMAPMGRVTYGEPVRRLLYGNLSGNAGDTLVFIVDMPVFYEDENGHRKYPTLLPLYLEGPSRNVRVTVNLCMGQATHVKRPVFHRVRHPFHYNILGRRK